MNLGIHVQQRPRYNQKKPWCIKVVLQGSRPRKCHGAVRPQPHVRQRSGRSSQLQMGFGVVPKGSRPRKCWRVENFRCHARKWPRRSQKLQEGLVVVSNGGSARIPGGLRNRDRARGPTLDRGNGIKAVRQLRGPKGPWRCCPDALCKAQIFVYYGNECQTKQGAIFMAPGSSACGTQPFLLVPMVASDLRMGI